MEQVIRIVLIMMFALSSVSSMACSDVYPGEPEFAVPNGSSATKDEMIDAQGNVKSYVSKVETYLACLDQGLSASATSSEDENANAEQHAIYELRYNAAVESMELVADQFNNALRDYKDAQ